MATGLPRLESWPLPVAPVAAAPAHLGPSQRSWSPVADPLTNDHAYQLASKFDATAPIPHTQDDYRQLFVQNTARATYTARVTSVTHFDVRDRLGRVAVPTLLLTPQDDKLVGEEAAKDMLAGIPDAREVVLPGTGHMFRFTHPMSTVRPSSTSSTSTW